MSNALRLPVEMTIYTAGETAAALREWLQAAPADGALQVQGDTVAEIDGAGLQLLAALQHSLAGQRRNMQWHTPSATLARACRMLGPGAPFADAGHGDAA